MNFVLAYFAHILTIQEKKLVDAKYVQAFRIGRNLVLAAGIVFAFSALPIFWTASVGGVPLRLLLWIPSVPLIWATSRLMWQKK